MNRFDVGYEVIVVDKTTGMTIDKMAKEIGKNPIGQKAIIRYINYRGYKVELPIHPHSIYFFNEFDLELCYHYIKPRPFLSLGDMTI